MAIERILGTDTGKAAFEKADRNFVNIYEDFAQVSPINTYISNATTFVELNKLVGVHYPETSNIGFLGEYTLGNLINIGYAPTAYSQYIFPSDGEIRILTRRFVGWANPQWSPWEKVITDKQPEWITVTLLNGWTGAVQYAKNDLGQIRLRGYLVPGTKTWGTTIATLPVGYRPPYTSPISCFVGEGAVVDGIILSTSGDLRIYSPASSSTSTSTWSFDRVLSVV